MSEHLATTFAAALKNSGLTGVEFAERLHISPQFVNDVKHGRRLPTPDRVLQFASQFSDVDSAEWLWLLLTDLWGEPIAAMMQEHAKASEDGDAYPGSDDPANHVYQRRGSWSGDDWCAVEGCTSRPSVHVSPRPVPAAGELEDGE